MADTKKILIADDDIGIRRLLDMILSLEGYELIIKEDGKEVLEYLKDNTPDLMILDVNMPFITGIDIVTRVKGVARLKDIPVIILTALKDERTQTQAQLARADLILTKPLEGKDFRDHIKRLLA